MVTPAFSMRTGIGVDIHRFGSDGPFFLAGLHWPDEHGRLDGHSDGDAAAHACCDALLSAAGLGDLGAIFGAAEPRWKGAAGVVLLTHVAELVREAGWHIDNIAVQVVGNRPKIGPRRHEAEDALSSAVGSPVTVAATTSDGLGFTGKGEGVAAIATALLHRD